MVDPKDLVLREVRDDILVHRLGAGEVVPERLLDDQAQPTLGPRSLAELVHNRADSGRWHGEVVDAVPLSAALLVEPLQQLHHIALAALRREVGGDVVHPGGEPLPDVLLHRIASELGDGLAHFLAPRLCRALGSGDSDNREVLGQKAAVFERVEGRNQLAMREIARRAEDHEHAWVR